MKKSFTNHKIIQCILPVLFFMFTLHLHAQTLRLWGSYFGGLNFEQTDDITTDRFGNVYMVGYTQSTSGLASGGFQNTYGGGYRDAFLVKFNSSGNRLWATYYGGTGIDEGSGVAADSAGNVYMVGYTTSAAGIASGGFQNTLSGSGDAFLVKFDANGNRLWATYYGGFGGDSGKEIAIDDSGFVYISGDAYSTTNVASGGFQDTLAGDKDAFLVKFNGSGNRIWATYYGGASEEDGEAVATDKAGNVFLGGYTTSISGIASNGFQNVSNGGYEAFLVKFNAGGNRMWATYYGGCSGIEYGESVATDSAGSVYLAGKTPCEMNIASGGFQNAMITGNGDDDVFLVKFDSSGNRAWSTYYGGDYEETDEAVACDNFGHVFLSGTTHSWTNLASGLASGGFQDTGSIGTYDAFLVKFALDGSRISATYYGGTNHDQGCGVAIDNNGNIFLGGITNSLHDIAYAGFQNTLADTLPGGANDAYLVKFDSCTGPPQPGFISGPATICVGAANFYSIPLVTGALSYTWSLPPGWTGTSTGNSIIITADTAFTGTIYVNATNGCGNSAKRSLVINALSTPTVSFTIAPIDTQCVNNSPVTLTGGNPAGGTYTGTGVNGTVFDPGISGIGNFAITYMYTSMNGCSDSASGIIHVDACAGIAYYAAEPKINIYPVPNTGEFTLSSDQQVNELKIEILDLEGRIIYNTKEKKLPAGFSENINLGNVNSGIYQLRITCDGRVSTQKIPVLK